MLRCKGCIACQCNEYLEGEAEICKINSNLDDLRALIKVQGEQLSELRKLLTDNTNSEAAGERNLESTQIAQHNLCVHRNDIGLVIQEKYVASSSAQFSDPEESDTEQVSVKVCYQCGLEEILEKNPLNRHQNPE